MWSSRSAVLKCVLKSNPALTWYRGALQPRLAHRTKEKPKALGQLSFSSSQSAEGISQSALGSWRSVEGGWRGTNAGWKAPGWKLIFLLKGGSMILTWGESPDVCLTYVLKEDLWGQQGCSKLWFHLYHSEGVTAIFLVTYFLPEGKQIYQRSPLFLEIWGY